MTDHPYDIYQYTSVNIPNGLGRSSRSLILALMVTFIAGCAISPPLRTYQQNIWRGEDLNQATFVASLPAIIPYSTWGSDYGWLYNYTVTFTESRGISAKVEWLQRVYIDRNGARYTSEYNGFKLSEPIEIKGHGNAIYSSFVRGPADSNTDLRGGTVIVAFSGHDVNGHFFSGRVSSRLALPNR